MLPALLLLVGLLAPATISPVTAVLDCSRDSLERCQNLQTATRCRAVVQCLKTTWRQPTKKTLACKMCRKVVKVGKKQKSKAGEQAMLKTLWGICKWLTQQEATRCQHLVDNHSQALLSLFVRTPASTSSQVCTALTLCKPRHHHHLLPSNLVPLSPKKSMYKAIAQGSPKGNVNLHPTRNLCKDKAFCEGQQVLYEAAQDRPSFQDVVEQEIYSYCDLCIVMIHRAQGRLQGEKSRVDITNALEAVCRIMPYILGHLCPLQMNGHTTELLGALPTATAYKECQILKKCPMSRDPGHKYEDVLTFVAAA
ncbi:proactivator polypeptide-like 1 [Rhynchocyon petersi]